MIKAEKQGMKIIGIAVVLTALVSTYFGLTRRVKAQNVLTNVPYSCTITVSTNTTTQCQPVPGVGLRLYVQSYQIMITAAGTATTIGLNDGTGTNCAGSTAALTPTYANTAATPINTIGLFVNFSGSGLVVPFNSAVCAVQAGTTAGTNVITINGYIGQ